MEKFATLYEGVAREALPYVEKILAGVWFYARRRSGKIVGHYRKARLPDDGERSTGLSWAET